MAVGFAGLFLLLAGVLMGAVLWLVDRTEYTALQSANDADVATIINGYRDEGQSEAIEVVRQILGSQADEAADYSPPAYILLADSAGRLAGNLPAMPAKTGVLRLALPAQAPPDAAPPQARAHHHPGVRRDPRAVILGRGEWVAPGLYVFVGRSTQALLATRHGIVAAFGWVILGAVALGCLGGLVFGLRFLRRVDAVTHTCEAIVAGRLQARIPAGTDGSEWSRLTRALNAMLDRMAELLENLRQVSSDLAHDLRTPLARLRTRLEDARASARSVTDYDAAVAKAIEDTDQLLALFAALLRISQVESGSRRATLRPVSLDALLGRVGELYRPVAEDRGQDLELQLEPGIAVDGDAELLLQMFSNLLENAMRHTPAGTRIRIGASRLPGSCEVFVTDNGPGIPESERGKVLQRFYQVSGSRSAGGHGLGLALVAAIARLHHAALTLSDAHPGLRVSVRFTS